MSFESPDVEKDFPGLYASERMREARRESKWACLGQIYQLLVPGYLNFWIIYIIHLPCSQNLGFLVAPACQKWDIHTVCREEQPLN